MIVRRYAVCRRVVADHSSTDFLQFMVNDAVAVYASVQVFDLLSIVFGAR